MAHTKDAVVYVSRDFIEAHSEQAADTYYRTRALTPIQMCLELGLGPDDITENTYLYVNYAGEFVACEKPMRGVREVVPADEAHPIGYLAKMERLHTLRVELEDVRAPCTHPEEDRMFEDDFLEWCAACGVLLEDHHLRKFGRPYPD